MIAAPSNYGSTLKVLACERCDDARVQAPLGDKVVAGGAYGSRLVADLVVNKYWYGLPLNRQREMLTRLGLDMPSSSMGDQIHWATELLEPIYRHLIGKALTSTVLHVDATSLPVKDKDSPTGLTIGSLWGYVGDESAVVFLYTRSGHKVGQVESEIGPETFLRLAQASSLRMQRPFSTRASSAKTSSRSAATCMGAATS